MAAAWSDGCKYLGWAPAASRAAAIAGSIMVQASAGGVLVVVMPQPADTIYSNVNPVWEFFKFSVEALH